MARHASSNGHGHVVVMAIVVVLIVLVVWFALGQIPAATRPTLSPASASLNQ